MRQQETIIRLERKPQGVERTHPGEIWSGNHQMTLWHAPESGREYLRVERPGAEPDWFRLEKTLDMRTYA